MPARQTPATLWRPRKCTKIQQETVAVHAQASGVDLPSKEEQGGTCLAQTFIPAPPNLGIFEALSDERRPNFVAVRLSREATPRRQEWAPYSDAPARSSCRSSPPSAPTRRSKVLPTGHQASVLHPGDSSFVGERLNNPIRAAGAHLSRGRARRFTVRGAADGCARLRLQAEPFSKVQSHSSSFPNQRKRENDENIFR